MVVSSSRRLSYTGVAVCDKQSSLDYLQRTVSRVRVDQSGKAKCCRNGLPPDCFSVQFLTEGKGGLLLTCAHRVSTRTTVGIEGVTQRGLEIHHPSMVARRHMSSGDHY